MLLMRCFRRRWIGRSLCTRLASEPHAQTTQPNTGQASSFSLAIVHEDSRFSGLMLVTPLRHRTRSISHLPFICSSISRPKVEFTQGARCQPHPHLPRYFVNKPCCQSWLRIRGNELLLSKTCELLVSASNPIRRRQRTYRPNHHQLGPDCHYTGPRLVSPRI